METLEGLLKTKNVADGHQDAFKSGFAEGFMKAQAMTQRTQGRHTLPHSYPTRGANVSKLVLYKQTINDCLCFLIYRNLCE